MQEYQERVIVEKQELAKKVIALFNFLCGEVINSLHPDEQVRLRQQYKYMTLYLDVLSERIANFGE